METVWGRQGGGMGVLPCGSYNYLVLLNLPMDYCTCQVCLLDRLHSRVRPWLRRRDSSPSAPKGSFSLLIRLFLAHSSLAKLLQGVGAPAGATVSSNVRAKGSRCRSEIGCSTTSQIFLRTFPIDRRAGKGDGCAIDCV